jgi:alpha-1,3-mannosyltransferase
MKLVHITRQYYPSVGGIETVVRNLSDYTRRAGHQVDVITLDRLFGQEHAPLAADEMVNGIRTKRLPSWGPHQYAIAPRILSAIDSYDLVHLHSSDFFLDYLAWTKLLHQKPLILSTHGLFFHTRFARLIKLAYLHTVTRLDLRWVSAICCDSENDMRLVRQIAPVEKVHLVPNGINYDQLSRLDVDGRDPFLMVSVGRLAPNKRFDRLLRAFSIAVREQRQARLVIIGPDWGDLAALRALAVELGVHDRVQFLGGVSEGDLLTYLSQAKVWLSSSAYEGFGIALIEAMAAGCVSVVQPLPSFRQVLEDETEGFHAEFDRPEHAAGVICRALSLTDAERARLVLRARAKAAQYSWETIVSRLETIYAQFI